ncbi:MAG: DNA topoisomerase IV subunit A [Alphaproteobacteria bacterium]|nr:DNA topoisomerase IV subunit A [Alphaproteobacteria bacterium]
MSDLVLDDDRARPVSLSEALSERYLAYALSTIVSRSLPDVRDGLKPVHRRLLYAMRELGLDPSKGPKKSARVVGEVIGRYHPHGDQSIYDALVRLAQDFAQRYPLIDGQGNFGNIDGDNAAAMRYTEARLTPIAQAMLEGINEDAVDYRPTYDGEGEEPVVLPAGFPNLLANGAQGIAVGMATSIPPHNADEVIAAAQHMIKHPDASLDTLLKKMPGPDFPTGGILVEDPANIREAYATGRGSFRVRAKWEKEEGKGGTYKVIVTEIPYQVQKSRLIERIADLLNQRKLPLLADVLDESTEDVRIVLEPKSRNVDPAVLMESLYRVTDLENKFALNMNVLGADQVPRVMGLQQVLRAFLDHRLEVLERRTRHRLGKIAARLEVLSGYLVAYLNLDEVIRIIREEDEPKRDLIAAFDLTEVQADAVLNMRLRNLRKLEEMEIRKEYDALKEEQADLTDLLEREDRRWTAIHTELGDLRKSLAKDKAVWTRRTDIAGAVEETEISVDAFVEKEPITVLLSKKSWIKAARGHLKDVSDVRYKEGDEGRFSLHAQTTDKILVVASDGRFFTLPADKLPPGRGFGEPLKISIDLADGAEVVAIRVLNETETLILASSDGRGFQVAAKDVAAQTRTGRQVMTPSKGATLQTVIPAVGDSVVVIGENRKMLVFPLEQLPPMQRGRGVILQRYKDGGLGDVTTVTLSEGLSWQAKAGVRTEPDLARWQANRATAGAMAPHGFPRDNKFAPVKSDG